MNKSRLHDLIKADTADCLAKLAANAKAIRADWEAEDPDDAATVVRLFPKPPEDGSIPLAANQGHDPGGNAGGEGGPQLGQGESLYELLDQRGRHYAIVVQEYERFVVGIIDTAFALPGTVVLASHDGRHGVVLRRSEGTRDRLTSGDTLVDAELVTAITDQTEELTLELESGHENSRP